MKNIIIFEPRRPIKQLKMMLVSIVFKVPPICFFGLVLIYFNPILSTNHPPQNSLAEAFVVLTPIIMMLMIFLMFINFMKFKKKLGWYPYLHGMNQYFFVKTSIESLEGIEIRDKRWSPVESERDKKSFSYTPRKSTPLDLHSKKKENNLMRKYTIHIDIIKINMESFALVWFEFKNTWLNKTQIIMVEPDEYERFIQLIEELLAPTAYYNEKWQKIDEKWNVVDPNPVAGAPEIIRMESE